MSKIGATETRELIRKSAAEAAHEIQQFGNDMAHGDILDAWVLRTFAAQG